MMIRKKLAALAIAGGLLAGGVAGAVPASATARTETTSTTPVPTKSAMQALLKRVNGSPNPKAAFDALPSRKKELLRLATTPYGAPKMHRLSTKGASSNARTEGVTAAYSGCWFHSDGVEWDNFWGWKLTDGYQTTHVCVTNGTVTNVWVDNVSGTGAWGWTLDKYFPSTINAGWEGRGAVQFNWTTNTADHHTSCLRIFVNANGYNWRTDGSCTA
ncbi:hypothetical protein ACVB8X_37665 [Streptomyces sp. NRAIS4]